MGGHPWFYFVEYEPDIEAALQKLRTDICERFIKDRSYRFVDMKTPKRATEFSDYRSTVEEWHDAIEKNYKRFLTEELAGRVRDS